MPCDVRMNEREEEGRRRRERMYFLENFSEILELKKRKRERKE